ncbi:MAG: phenylalanine--tRNA ligase subunit beta [Armatimonadota bacterium]
MRVPYSWLMEYLKADIDVETLAHELTMGGLEVEAIDDWTSEDGEASDDVLITSVTSNRGDLLSLTGVARHAAAILGAEWSMPEINMDLLGDVISGDTKADSEQMTIELSDPEACPRYSGLVMENLEAAESPDWLGYRLEAAGMRPIANLVDCTNYVMLELGQPLHGFDYNLLKDGHIIVRRAEEGEQVLTLDQQWRTMTAEDLLITDPNGPVAIAGVMGGADTEMTWDTEKVLLESAHFDAITIRKTAMRLGLSSEASYRFERIVDPGGTLRTLARLAALLQETAGGQIVGDAVDACAIDPSPREVQLRVQRCNDILGTDISAEQMEEYLQRLQFGAEAEGETIQVAVPTFRPDVEREIDVIEEVAIVHGYDNIPTTVPGSLNQSGVFTREQKLERRAREALRAAGLNESIGFAMISQEDFDRLGFPEDASEREMVPLASPMIEEQSHMRTVLVPTLMQQCEHNQRQRVGTVRLYEIAHIFIPRETEPLPEERQHAAGLVMGPFWTSRWNLGEDAATPDFFHVKGIVEQLVDELGVQNVTYERSTHPSCHPGQCAGVMLDGAAVGFIGKINDDVREKYELQQDVFVFEVDLDALIDAAEMHETYEQLSRFPAALRDIAVVVEDTEDNTVAAIQQAIKDAAGEPLSEVEFFDLFADEETLGEGKRSLAFKLIFRTPEGTLTDEEVDALVEDIVSHLAEEFDAKLRE